MKFKYIGIPLFVALLTGCASGGGDYYEIRESRIGQHRDNLVSEIGEPSIQLHAPNYSGGVEVMRYVYMDQAEVSGCVDIYIVEKASGKIVEYICQ